MCVFHLYRIILSSWTNFRIARLLIVFFHILFEFTVSASELFSRRICRSCEECVLSLSFLCLFNVRPQENTKLKEEAAKMEESPKDNLLKKRTELQAEVDTLKRLNGDLEVRACYSH